jgi:uncharacterized protein (TIGR02246 family)
MSATAVTTNRALLEAYADAKGAHDVDLALSFCHDDFAYETAGVAGSRIEGREAARAFYTQLFEVLPDYFGDFDGMVVDGDTGVAWGRFGGTSSITGRRIELPVTFVCTFRDGLLVSDTGYFDSRTFYELLGAPHPADAEAADFVDRFQAAWKARDLDSFAGLIHDDVDALFPGMPEPMPKPGVVDWLRAAITTFPDVELTVQRWARTGDSVLIEWESTASVPGSGERLAWGGADRFTLRDGRADVERVYFDTAPVSAALERS